MLTAEQPYPGVPKNKIALYHHDPFDYERLYGVEKYRLGAMVVAETSAYPHYVDTQENVFSVYNDRCYAAWVKVWEGVKSNSTGDAWYNGVSEKDLLRVGNLLAAELGFTKPVTAVRIVRYTNLSSGYPCYLFIGTHGGKKVKLPRQQYRGYDDYFGRF